MRAFVSEFGDRIAVWTNEPWPPDDMVHWMVGPEAEPSVLVASVAMDPAQMEVARQGFAFVDGHDTARLLARSGPLDDWDRFAASWNDLALDRYMADGGRYRRRRHAAFEATDEGRIVRTAHQPHYQSRDYNVLHGGIARWFEPIDPAVASGRTLDAILACARTFFESLAPTRHWHVEVHQFRIEARADERGRPTPEGIHRDGVDYVGVLLVDRVNIVSGTTSVHALDGRELGTFTLASPLDAVFLDDSRVAHGVTPIEPLDPSRPAHRDVLVVTLVAYDRRPQIPRAEQPRR